MILEDFSAGYLLASDIDVEPYSGKRAVVREDYHRALAQHVGLPVVGRVGDYRFEIDHESALPADLIALPASELSDADDTLLIERR